MQAVAQHLARTVQYGLSLVVHKHTGGSRGVPCRLELGSAAAGTEPDERPFDDDAGSGANEQAGDVAVAARRQAPSHARRRRVPDGEATLAADAGVSDDGDCAPSPPPHIPAEPLAIADGRSSRPSRAHTPSYAIVVALSAFVWRACILPRSTLMGQIASSFKATVVGDPRSSSRAIASRYGGVKRDAVLWVSSRS